MNLLTSTKLFCLKAGSNPTTTTGFVNLDLLYFSWSVMDDKSRCEQFLVINTGFNCQLGLLAISGASWADLPLFIYFERSLTLINEVIEIEKGRYFPSFQRRFKAFLIMSSWEAFSTISVSISPRRGSTRHTILGGRFDIGDFFTSTSEDDWFPNLTDEKERSCTTTGIPIDLVKIIPRLLRVVHWTHAPRWPLLDQSPASTTKEDFVWLSKGFAASRNSPMSFSICRRPAVSIKTIVVGYSPCSKPWRMISYCRKEGLLYQVRRQEWLICWPESSTGQWLLDVDIDHIHIKDVHFSSLTNLLAIAQRLFYQPREDRPSPI